MDSVVELTLEAMQQPGHLHVPGISIYYHHAPPLYHTPRYDCPDLVHDSVWLLLCNYRILKTKEYGIMTNT